MLYIRSMRFYERGAVAFLFSLMIQAGAPVATAPDTVPPAPSPGDLPAYFHTGVLTLQDRIWAQTQIERVWYNHRIWPKENPGPKPPFEQLVPRAMIEKKAVDVLRMGAALKQYWNVEITPPMLQAEMDRMERESKDRATLHELFAALRNDPFLIAEMLSRSILTEKALRHHYAWDPRMHITQKRMAGEIEHMLKNDADWTTLEIRRYRRRFVRDDAPDTEGDRRVGNDQVDILRLTADEMDLLRKRLAQRSPNELRENEQGWLAERLIADGVEGIDVESLFVPKQSFDGWWRGLSADPDLMTIRSPAPSGSFILPAQGPAMYARCDAWERGFANIPPPSRASGHAAIWTGSEMIVWGMYDRGGRYNPVTDSWTLTAPINVHFGDGAPIWTGTEMIIWGGFDGGNFVNTGGRYNPGSDMWTVISTGTNAPSGRSGNSVVWTGDEMIIWGGRDRGTVTMNTGGRYKPATDSWLPTSTGANVPPGRQNHTGIWTGSLMIVWGGDNSNTGGRYDPATDGWTPTSTGANLPEARSRYQAVWTGTEMIVWGGIGVGAVYFNNGARYNLAMDNWTPTSIGASVPAPRMEHSAIWSGSEMIVWGGFTSTNSYTNTGGRYNPVTDTWLQTSTGSGVPTPRMNQSAVWTGNQMILWGGYSFTTQTNNFNDGGRYNPATDTWIPMTTDNDPVGHGGHTAVWTGSELITWGGANSTADFNTGGRYIPALDRWFPTSMGSNVPEPRNSHTAIWTGNEMIVWGGISYTTQYNFYNSGGRYNPVKDLWIPTSRGVNVPVARWLHTAVWTGREMVIWGGGTGGSGNLNSGGRYDPATDSWRPTFAGGNVPAPRWRHTAVWTGTEMVIWGGYGSTLFNTGGRYNPDDDSWAPTPNGSNVPSARQGHTAVWTGNEMVVWGGFGIVGGTELNSGGRCDITSGRWLPTSIESSTPAARAGHAAVWTGNEMIIWGSGWYSYFNTGGRYSPASDHWKSTSTDPNEPFVYRGYTATWTGDKMIVWSGYEIQNGSTGFGSYYSGSVSSPGNTLLGGKSPSAVRLNWSSVNGAGSYNVKRCDASAAACIPGTIVSSPTIPQYSEPNNPTSYFYSIEAVNQCGSTP